MKTKKSKRHDNTTVCILSGIKKQQKDFVFLVTKDL